MERHRGSKNLPAFGKDLFRHAVVSDFIIAQDAGESLSLRLERCKWRQNPVFPSKPVSEPRIMFDMELLFQQDFLCSAIGKRNEIASFRQDSAQRYFFMDHLHVLFPRGNVKCLFHGNSGGKMLFPLGIRNPEKHPAAAQFFRIACNIQYHRIQRRIP